MHWNICELSSYYGLYTWKTYIYIEDNVGIMHTWIMAMKYFWIIILYHRQFHLLCDCKITPTMWLVIAILRLKQIWMKNGFNIQKLNEYGRYIPNFKMFDQVVWKLWLSKLLNVSVYLLVWSEKYPVSYVTFLVFVKPIKMITKARGP